ncbi:MAG: YegP family protein [Leptolyngbyaceae cyanobacterium]
MMQQLSRWPIARLHRNIRTCSIYVRYHWCDVSKGSRSMAYYIYQDQSSQWRWHLKASNGRIVADSAESYWNKSDCLHGIQLVQGSHSAPVYQA